MPEGDRRGEVDFHDFTYDGVKKEGMLYKGLGQLADGEYGQDNFRLDLRGRGIKVRTRLMGEGRMTSTLGKSNRPSDRPTDYRV